MVRLPEIANRDPHEDNQQDQEQGSTEHQATHTRTYDSFAQTTACFGIQ